MLEFLDPADRLLDPTAAADVLGVKVCTLAEWRGRDFGPKFTRIGNKLVRYRLGDLMEFRDRGLVEPGANRPDAA